MGQYMSYQSKRELCSNDDDDGNENVKKKHQHQSFFWVHYLAVPGNQEVKFPYAVFCGGRTDTRKQESFFLFLNSYADPRIQLQENSPTLSTLGGFDSDVFATVAVVRNVILNLRNRTGKERRRQTLCDKRENNCAPPNLTLLLTGPL